MIYKKSWKYILVKDKSFNYRYYRPKAIKDFSNVKKYDIGGYVSSYRNLSQSGNCWIYDKARVTGDAQVFKNAIITGDAIVSNDVQITDNAKVSGQSLVIRNVKISGNANIENQTLTKGVYK